VNHAEPPQGRIGPIADPNEVRELTLVLSSMQVAFHVREEGNLWVILVGENDLPRAAESIRLYRAENRNWPPRRAREVLPYPRSVVAPLVSLALLVFYGAVGPYRAGSWWSIRGAAVSDRILHGQIWRAVTALTLHGSAMHVLGNALAGTIFLSAVSRRLGSGRAALLVLLAGGLGNALNALYHRAGHTSVGASTAVFGAVGILVVTQLAVNRHVGTRTWIERVAPVLGGLALLGMLGAEEHSDLTAHLFGLIAGAAIASPFALRHRPLRRTEPWLQVLSGTLALALIGLSWAGAWRLDRYLW
jgi:membrane associated rhomboid family serine protease